MISNDNQQYITVELFNSKMETFITQIKLDNEQLRNELRAEIQSVTAQVQVNSAKIEMLQHTFYWGFAILAFIAAFVPLFKREHKEEKALTHESVLEIVNEAIAKYMRNINVVGK